MTKLKYLKELAQKATNDEDWVVHLSDNATPFVMKSSAYDFKDRDKMILNLPPEITLSFNSFNNAKFIAAANPRTVIKLVAEIEELQSELNKKNENGCCIVEHGYRIEAEHRVRDLEKEIERLKSVERDHLIDWKRIQDAERKCETQGELLHEVEKFLSGCCSEHEANRFLNKIKEVRNV